jgi:trk system potassium uptake protein TrkH
MLLGALPFAWYIRAVTRGHVRSEQVGTLVIGLALVIATLSLWRVAVGGVAPLTALREVAFNVISVVSTTGYATTDYMLWGSFAGAAFFVLTALGGCTGSTSGGAKTMRWIVFARSLRVQVRRIHLPNAMTTLRYEGRALGDDVVLGMISFFSFYFATFAVLAVMLGFVGLDFLTATSGALTALANVGPGVGEVIGPAGNFAGLNDPAKLILSFGMYVGRLEMLTVFVLFTRRFWAAV